MNTQPIDFTEKLPILTEVVGEHPTGVLPVLTEVVVEPAEVAEAAPVELAATLAAIMPTHELSAFEMQSLLQHLEAHLETTFTRKLNDQLSELQKLAVDLAVSELKSELPQLLRDALKHQL